MVDKVAFVEGKCFHNIPDPARVVRLMFTQFIFNFRTLTRRRTRRDRSPASRLMQYASFLLSLYGSSSPPLQSGAVTFSERFVQCFLRIKQVNRCLLKQQSNCNIGPTASGALIKRFKKLLNQAAAPHCIQA